MLCCALLTEFSVEDESGSAEGVVPREDEGMLGCGRGRGRGRGRSAASASPGSAAPEAPVTSNRTRTREVWPAARLDTRFFVVA